MAGEFFKQFGAITTDWMLGAFVGATLDYVFNMIHTKSHLLNLISACIQLTCATFIVHEFLYGMGLRRGSQTIQGTWILFDAVWIMSPNAEEKLKNSYYAFHKLLYGTRSLVPEQPEEEKKASCKC